MQSPLPIPELENIYRLLTMHNGVEPKINGDRGRVTFRLKSDVKLTFMPNDQKYLLQAQTCKGTPTGILSVSYDGYRVVEAILRVCYG